MEIIIGLVIMVIVLLAAVVAVRRGGRGIRTAARVAAGQARAQEMLTRLEKELVFARGYSPQATLVDDLDSTATKRARVSTTVAFPNNGMLLLARGTPQEERIQYLDFDPVGGNFTTLLRSQQCTNASTHLAGDVLYWAGLAEPIENQVAPAAEFFDGIAIELTGPVFFRGDGSGFSYQMPVDPTGGTNYIVNGEPSWGATVQSVPMNEGWSVLYFQQRAVASEVAMNQDFNGDGDRLDLFDVGEIRQRSFDATVTGGLTTDLALCPSFVIQEQCNWGGDLDFDGFADPLFLWNPTTSSLHIRLFLIDIRDGNSAIQSRTEAVIYLRNASS